MVVALVATVVGVSSSASADEVDDSIGRAECGPGSDPETGVQGQVPAADRISGRSMQGYRCNLELLGQYQGTGSGPVSPVADRCSYSATFAGGLLSRSPGVQVVDASDPTNPRLSKILGSTAMKISTWETLKVNKKRGLMVGAGVQVLPGLGVGALDVYDVSKDCANPTLLNGTGRGQNTKPLLIVAHEGGFTPDGMTYYATSAYGGTITAVDLANPARPRTVFIGAAGLTNHGFSFSEGGRTMYGVTAVPAGLQIIDVSDIQDRKKIPLIREISSLSWADGLASQMTIPFISKGHPYLYVVDEAGNGNVRVVDIEDPRNPKVIRKMRLEIGNEANAAKRSEDVGGDGLFGYESHYCTIDKPVDPTALACGYFQSGIRVFDVRNIKNPREIAYFNPPAKTGSTLADLPNSTHALIYLAPPLLSAITLRSLADSVLRPDLSADWCMSPPEFMPDGQLWVTCNDNGFLALKFTNGAYPLE